MDKVAREKGQTVLRVRHLVGPEARPGMDYCLKVRPASFSLWEDIGFPVEAGGLLAKLRPGARVLVTGRITRVNVGRITIASQNYRPVIPEGDRMCFWFYVQLQDWQVRLARAGGRLW